HFIISSRWTPYLADHWRYYSSHFSLSHRASTEGDRLGRERSPFVTFAFQIYLPWPFEPTSFSIPIILRLMNC
ncbi:MAG: hypothetical protein ACKOD1_06615, partial [Sphingomonadales bacterium]